MKQFGKNTYSPYLDGDSIEQDNTINDPTKALDSLYTEQKEIVIYEILRDLWLEEKGDIILSYLSWNLEKKDILQELVRTVNGKYSQVQIKKYLNAIREVYLIPIEYSQALAQKQHAAWLYQSWIKNKIILYVESMDTNFVKKNKKYFTAIIRHELRYATKLSIFDGHNKDVIIISFE